MSQPITVVVPLVEAHDRWVPTLIDSLAQESQYIREVILARSQLGSEHSNKFREWARSIAKTTGLPIRVESTPHRASAGENRNRGWSVAQSEFVAFVDADDLYLGNRLESMLLVAREFSSNLVVHDFWSSESEWKSSGQDSWEVDDVVQSQQLFAATFPLGRDRRREGITPGDTNLIVPKGICRRHTIHHGHVLVRREIHGTVKYGRRYPGEDGQFCRDVLWKLGGVEYIPARLSVYRADLTAERGARLVDKVVRRLRALPDQGISALYR